MNAAAPDAYKRTARRRETLETASPPSLSLTPAGTTGTLVPVKFEAIDLSLPLARG
jgi:hypothetical protein